jgi:hypothetical protein
MLVGQAGEMVIPVRDVNPVRPTPWVTYVLIVMRGAPGSHGESAVAPYPYRPRARAAAA